MHHTSGEHLVTEAERASRDGESERATELYLQAAEGETSALHDLGDDKQRTKGITAVSAVALWYKGHDFARAEGSAHSFLAGPAASRAFQALQLDKSGTMSEDVVGQSQSPRDYSNVTLGSLETLMRDAGDYGDGY